MRETPYRKSLERAKRYQRYDKSPKAKYANAARAKFGGHWITPVIIIISDIYGNIHEAASDYKQRRHQKEIENLEQETVKLNRSLTRWTFALALFSILTFFVSLGTLLVLKGQLGEMHSGSGDTHALATAAQLNANTSQDALVANSRAWVGPSGATMVAAPTIGQNSDFVVAYQNTGREPAVGFMTKSDAFTAASDSQSIQDGTNKLAVFINGCLQINPVIGAQVVFPNSGIVSNNTMTISVSGEKLIDKGVVEGDKFLVVIGCFAYQTLKVSHHTTFCFMYKKGITTLPNLNFCASGSYAD